MLPSLNKFFMPATHQPARLELDINRTSVTARMMAARTQRILWDKQWPIADHMKPAEWCGPVAKELNQLIGATAPQILCSLPDPMLRIVRLAIDQLPRKTADREALIKWRLQEEFYLKQEEYCLDYRIEQENGENILSVYALDAHWQQQLQQEFLRHRLLVSAFQTHTMTQILAQRGNAWRGFVINAADEYLSYGIFREDVRPILLESQFFAKDDGEERYRFLQRGRRELAASQIQSEDTDTLELLVLGSIDMSDAIAELFSTYTFLEDK